VVSIPPSSSETCSGFIEIFIPIKITECLIEDLLGHFKSELSKMRAEPPLRVEHGLTCKSANILEIIKNVEDLVHTMIF